MKLLGISAYYHDSAACLIVDGQIISASQEERFTRKKHDSEFPIHAIRCCLDAGGIQLRQVDWIVFYDKPILKFDRLLETYLAFAPRGFRGFSKSLPIWVKGKLFQRQLIINTLSEYFGRSVDWSEKLLFSEHHLSHASSAFFPSPFEEAAILTIDGVGEWATTSLAIGSGNSLSIHKEIQFPHSLGLLYSAFTYYTGFKVNSGEYKVMGLAPYGEPKYANLIKDHLIDIKDDGTYRLNMDYFDYCIDLKMTNAKFERLFCGHARRPESLLTQKEMDLAASIQVVLEEVVLKLAKGIRNSTGQKNLCLAGGVALNCVANGKLLRANYFENIWIQPASGDAGGAIGAALGAYHLMLNQSRKVINGDAMQGSFLGPQYSQTEIEQRLRAIGAVFSVVTVDEMIHQAVDAIVAGKAVGWHQGQMEFGPRSLGSRSILADPRSPLTQKKLNLKVKYRESFRPFAPSILAEHASEWFDINVDSPYMLFVADIKKEKRISMSNLEQELFGIEKLNIPRSTIPAVTHIDYSARIQTVHSETNPLYHKLVTEFFNTTGCPVLVNTSFNIRGEPIVNSPEDAFKSMMGTEMEFLVIGNCILRKEEQDANKLEGYEGSYELD
jgi:carbamoyltransferase